MLNTLVLSIKIAMTKVRAGSVVHKYLIVIVFIPKNTNIQKIKVKDNVSFSYSIKS